MKLTDKKKLIEQFQVAAHAGNGGEAGRRRRAFDLAHRVFRRLENAAETASRERWSVLAGPAHRAPSLELECAAHVASAVIKYPVHGEAAVYAAILDAVDLAHALSEQLYQEWLKTQRDSDPVPLPEPGTNRTGAPLAPGCLRRECCAGSDDAPASGGQNV